MNMETHIEARQTYFLLKIIKKVSFFNFLDKKIPTTACILEC